MSRSLSVPSAPSVFTFRPAALPGLLRRWVDRAKITEVCRRGCPFTFQRIAEGQDVVAVRDENGDLRFADPHKAGGHAIKSKEEVLSLAREKL